MMEEWMVQLKGCLRVSLCIGIQQESICVDTVVASWQLIAPNPSLAIQCVAYLADLFFHPLALLRNL